MFTKYFHIPARFTPARTCTAAVLLVSGVLVAVTGTAGSAQAAGQTDLVLIDTDRIDVALIYPPLPNNFEPTGPARFLWQPDFASNTYTPKLEAVVAMRDASGFCGKVKITAYDAANTVIDRAQSFPLCPTSNSIDFDPAEPTLSAIPEADLHHVTVEAMLQLAPGGYARQAAVDVYP
ncbi:hypothetical protein GCM10010112_82620 [Actinoplanes lobatus]|uniref:Uncharacterized protein n=1 Tax=Actinoplanes lobatus TaxID=113568 RepID=A0A7W7MJN9_9ACTN|nr:hypothetical protein [Actinoplanes lobatus]MBB4752551.1 hypothetical protein [Actinoplanes lobatus]GGN93869.1 hypothetical protein GCM10010112_82620 [Actinoplanes lobatus]GIE44849.1 hypothetical protein Alo02nite_77470 [Actinoplanes lobatus]